MQLRKKDGPLTERQKEEASLLLVHTQGYKATFEIVAYFFMSTRAVLVLVTRTLPSDRSLLCDVFASALSKTESTKKYWTKTRLPYLLNTRVYLNWL